MTAETEREPRTAAGLIAVIALAANVALFARGVGIIRRLERSLDDRWFLDPSWQLGEQDATRDLQQGRVTRYDSDEAFLASLMPPSRASVSVAE